VAPLLEVVRLSAPVVETQLPGLSLLRRGKVRDVYDAGDSLLIVATDRLSAFDYVLGSGIPDKGKILTQMSAFWFEQLADVVPNHLLSLDPADFPAAVRPRADLLRGRAMLVRKTSPLPIECVARGYLAGSGWKDYAGTGRLCGIALPPGLVESDRLPSPIFTPATKAETGHDENISEERAAEFVGADLLQRVRSHTLELYRRAAAHAEPRGILIADTKFEFGIDATGAGGRLLLIDEALTPDSSRFWPLDEYRPGRSQPSFDKQYVRDYLERIRWNKQPPVPSLPADVVERTRAKYLEAYRRLTGRDLA
jgi:phosphoribosylaminoimidazole-succinocarboxamide synthase